VFAVSLRMSLDDVRGGLTPAQKQAYRSYELGDDWQAIRVLSGEFFADEASLRQQEAPDRKAVASLVRRGRQLIAMLAATNDMHRFLDIRSVFRLIIDYALKADVELDAVYEYIYQWADGNRDPEAILLAQKLLGKQSYCADPENKAPLLFLAARFMLKADRYEEATAYYEEAKALLLPMIAEDYPYAYQYSQTCSALAGLYMKAARFEDAYAVCEEAVRVWRGPAEAEPEKYLPYAAGAYYQLGVFFEKTGRRQEADAAYAEALALAEKDPDSYGCREIIEALS
jgi:tetratricopeptide (TPR) repeat protein